MPTERRVRRDPRERLQRPLPTVSHIEAAAAARVSALTSLPDAYLGPILTLSSPLPASVLASSSSPCLISLVYCFPIFGNRCFNSILSAPRSSFNFVMNVTFFTSATPVSLLSVQPAHGGQGHVGQEPWQHSRPVLIITYLSRIHI